MDSKRGTLFVLLAGVLWGCISLFVRALTAAGFTSPEISSELMVVGCVGMFLVLLVKDRKKLKIRLGDLWIFVGTGVVSVTLFNICYFSTMQRSEASVAVVLLYTSPVFVMLMSALLFKERITARKLLALGMTLAGCVLVAGLLGGSVHLTPLVLLMGVGSGFFYATYSIFGQIALSRYDTLTVTFYTFLLGSAASLPLSHPAQLLARLAERPGLIALCLGIGIFCTILPYLFYTQGLRNMEASRAAILATVEPLVGALLGILVYHESAGWMKLLGMALIFASVFVLNGRRREG